MARHEGKFMRGNRGIVENLGILTAGQVSAQLLNVWALVFLADRLGAHWFGVVQVGVAFMGYALVVAEGGMFAFGIREVSRLDDSRTVFDYAGRHAGMLALQAVAVIALGVVVIPLLPFHAADPWILPLYLVAVVPQVLQFEWLATGLERMTLVGATRIVRSLVYAALVLLVLVPMTGVAGVPAPRWVPVFFLAAMAAGNLLVAVASRHWFGPWLLPRLPTATEMRRRWRESLPIGLANLVLRLLLNVDLLVLGILATPTAAGHYAAASRIIFLLVVGIEVLWSALLPRLSRLAATDMAAFRRAFNLYLGGVVAVLLPVAVGGFQLGADVIDLLYRGKFAESVPIFRILAVSYSLLAVAVYLGNSLVAADRQRRYVWPLVLGAIVATLGAVVLVNRFGAVGASWAMLAGHSLLALVLAVVTRKWFRPALGFLAVQLATAVALMALAVDRCDGSSLFVRVAVGAAVYGLLAALPLRWFVGHHRTSSPPPEGPVGP